MTATPTPILPAPAAAPPRAAPRSFSELIAYLHARPHVRCGAMPLNFARHDPSGVLWFSNEHGWLTQVPAFARLGAEGYRPQVDYHEDRFEVTVFGHTERYRYEEAPT